ncbi:Gfo/Idh/MocA family protein [Providencia heimbachae]|uniref:Gfo/Idh/MocA family protein n=1 Tax=Providencia TaxID=586 RepID=UPI000837FEE5|nr:Gfo/Idh/MocA family oxidoreductase [Providencia heimbachae]NIH23983.1 Gfo/Idh/MocA family oxidoreductase [Providencia heimbachae]
MERIAVVGLGNIATRHRRNLKHLFPNSTLYAMSASGREIDEIVSDADACVSSIDELINLQLQLVIIASPAPFHAQHAIPLIEAKIPVLIEKPVATTLSDARAIKQAAKHYQTPVAIGYCLRYLSSSQKINEIIESKIIGQLQHATIEIGQYLPDWRPSKDYRECVSANASLGGGALLELSHELDYTYWLLGPLTLQHAILRSSDELNLDIEDNVDILATTIDNAIVHIHLDFLQRKAYRQCRFIGSQGTLEWNLINNEIRFISSHNTRVLYSAPEWDKNQMYLEMIADFIEKINNKENKSITIDEAINTLSLIEQIKSKNSISRILTTYQ